MARWLAALALASFVAVGFPVNATPPPVEVYGKLPGFENVHISRSGGRYAFVADIGNGRRLYVMSSDGKPMEIVGVGERKVIDLAWAGEDYVLVHLSNTVNVGADWTVSKMELSSVVVLNLRTHKVFTVFGKHDSVNSAVFGDYGVAHVGDRWYGFFGGQTLEYIRGGMGDTRYVNTTTEGNYITINTDLYRVDLETGSLSMVASGEASSAGWLVGPDGRVVARTTRNQKSGAWRVMTGASGGRLLSSGVSPFNGVDILGLGRNGDSILISHAGDDGTAIEDAPLAGGAPKPIVRSDAADWPLQDAATGRWIGTISNGDEPVYTMFSSPLDARVRAARKAFSGYFTRLVSQSDDFDHMIVFTDGKDDAGTYWIVNIPEKSAHPLGYAYPKIASQDVGQVRMMDYKAADGLALRGVLTLPPGRAPKSLPLVVMPHGGPSSRDYPGFDWWAQAYAAQGYAVFQPNFRGSSGYGAKLLDAGDGQWGRKMQTDISDGVAELGRQGIVDPKRACIVGASYGGYAALAGVTVQHGLYRCAVSVAGVTDLQKMYATDTQESGYSEDVTRGLKRELGDRAGWREISPAKLAEKADAPILLIHGKDDTVVPISQSDVMEKALIAAGKPVERLTLAGTDHHLLKEDTRIALLKASVAFVEKYNPPDQASSPIAAVVH